jgi:hypothetical protein
VIGSLDTTSSIAESSAVGAKEEAPALIEVVEGSEPVVDGAQAPINRPNTTRVIRTCFGSRLEIRITPL